MRTVPESIKLALEDASLPVKKRILLYRRVWNAQSGKYVLETAPADLTPLLVEAGSIKMALDTDEVDKWDASNVTLTFNNELNCFKEGLEGGLFENAVLWGSKLVYKIENAAQEAPQESITVFTGYIYTSPVLRDNGNRIELTATSSLDALEYVSAEDYCLRKTDEQATEADTDNDKDQGKEFTTQETGVGYVDSVKYGADLQSALTLTAGTDYEIGDTNEYALPAKVSLKFTPTAGYKMWLSYRYWHKDMKIEDIVNALLDLAGVKEREVEKAAFEVENGAVLYEDNLPEKCYGVLFGYDAEADNWQMRTFRDGSLSGRHPMNIGLWLRSGDGYEDTRPFRVPARGYFSVGLPLAGGYVFAGDFTDDFAYLFYQDGQGNGLKVNFCKTAGYRSQILRVSAGQETVLYDGIGRAVAGFELDANNLIVYTDGHKSNGANDGAVLQRQVIPCVMSGEFKTLTCKMGGTSYSDVWNIFLARLGWRERGVTSDEYQNCNRVGIYNNIFASADARQFSFPGAYWPLTLAEEATKWRELEYNKAVINNGTGEWSFRTGEDGENWTNLVKITSGMSFLSDSPRLEVYYKSTSLSGVERFENLRISSYISSSEIPLVNLTDLTVGEAIAQLAKMVAYEIGFNQDGVFFFRSRQGTYAGVELDASKLIEVDNNSADVDSLVNRVSVEFGNFKTVVDDFTEGKSRPNTIDTYGLHTKEISADNFIPAGNVDISAAVAKANYDTLSVPGFTLQAECRPDLSLELGDKITVSSENSDLADPQWSDYTKFSKLPVWKRVFKILGLEFDFDKRLMTLDLKDVTTDNDVPAGEYVEYQTTFPTPLDYKE